MQHLIAVETSPKNWDELAITSVCDFDCQSTDAELCEIPPNKCNRFKQGDFTVF
jgi:hypothetical protein